MDMKREYDVAQAVGRELTLHQKILTDIRGRILSGEWQPGFRLPFEVELAEQYGCSRMTVNKVMTHLVNAGLIVRQRKAGSFVARPRVESAILEIGDIETDVKSLGAAYAYTLMTRKVRRASAGDRRVMEVAARTSIIEVLAIHKANGKPFCVEERLVNADNAPGAAAADFSATPPGQWLLLNMPWTTAEHRIHARDASSDLARLLDIKKNAACLLVERRTWGDAGPITWVRLTYPGDSHSLVARFTPA